MSKDFVVLNTWIYHGEPKPAKHLSDGDHILFGGKVWMISDAEFKQDGKYPNDLQIQMLSVSKVGDKMEKIEQTITVERDFEVQPLIIAVLPDRVKTPVEEAVDA